MRPFISMTTAIRVYKALILPHFDYCSPVWDCLSSYLSEKLQTFQNRTARVATISPCDTSSNLFLSKLKWDKLSVSRNKQTGQASRGSIMQICCHFKTQKCLSVSRNKKINVKFVIKLLSQCNKTVN